MKLVGEGSLVWLRKAELHIISARAFSKGSDCKAHVNTSISVQPTPISVPLPIVWLVCLSLFLSGPTRPGSTVLFVAPCSQERLRRLTEHRARNPRSGCLPVIKITFRIASKISTSIGSRTILMGNTTKLKEKIISKIARII